MALLQFESKLEHEDCYKKDDLMTEEDTDMEEETDEFLGLTHEVGVKLFSLTPIVIIFTTDSHWTRQLTWTRKKPNMILTILTLRVTLVIIQLQPSLKIKRYVNDSKVFATHD